VSRRALFRSKEPPTSPASGNIHEGSGTIRLELERLWVGRERNASKAIAARSIDDSERSAPIADVHPPALASKRTLSASRRIAECAGAQNVAPSSMSHVPSPPLATNSLDGDATNPKPLGSWNPRRLWTRLRRARSRISNRAVPECSDEEPLTPRVNVHVVDAPFNARQADRLN